MGSSAGDLMLQDTKVCKIHSLMCDGTLVVTTGWSTYFRRFSLKEVRPMGIYPPETIKRGAVHVKQDFI